MKPGVFLAGHRVFSREEFAAVLRRRGRTEATLDSHLSPWRRQGHLVARWALTVPPVMLASGDGAGA